MRSFSDRVRPTIASAVAVVAALFVTYTICRNGVPILRHDWSFPITSWSLPQSIETLFQPWLPTGIGFPQPYPTFYATGFLLLPLAVLPPILFMDVFVFAIALLVSLGGASLTRSVNDSIIVRIAAALLSVLNPWVYSEFVAGHILMVLAFAILLFTAAELLREKPRDYALVVCCAFMVSQLEFFAFALIPLVWWLIRSRRVLPLLSLCIAFTPIAIGIVLHYGDIRGTPFLLEWQRAQSIAPRDAFLLRGYFAHYDASFDAIAPFLYLIPIALVSTLVVAWRERARLVLGAVFFGTIAILCATGTRGPIAPIYTWLVTHVTEAGVFRELYDLVAFGVVACIISISFIARVKAVRLAALALALACSAPWIITNPSRFFVPESSVQPLRFRGNDHERVALFPIAQPVKFGDEGSGYDYDLFAQANSALPINTFFPAFPNVNALRDAENGDTRDLAALGVRALRTRPQLRTDWKSLQYVFLPPTTLNAVPPSTAMLDAYPIVGVIDGVPQRVSLARSQSAPGIFFADDPFDPTFHPIQAPQETTNPKIAWIDARLAFFRYPFLSTAFGGAFTSSNRAFRLPNAPDVLLWTDGAVLSDSGRIIASRTPDLQWVAMPSGANSVHCEGTCALVAVGNPGSLPLEAAKQRPKPLAFAWLSPWLLRAEIPHHDVVETLRFSDLYDRSWAILGADGKHVRLNEVLNGWVLEPSGDATALIVNLTAALQFLFEIGAICGILILFRESRRRCSEL